MQRAALQQPCRPFGSPTLPASGRRSGGSPDLAGYTEEAESDGNKQPIDYSDGPFSFLAGGTHPSIHSLGPAAEVARMRDESLSGIMSMQLGLAEDKSQDDSCREETEEQDGSASSPSADSAPPISSPSMSGLGFPSLSGLGASTMSGLLGSMENPNRDATLSGILAMPLSDDQQGGAPLVGRDVSLSGILSFGAQDTPWQEVARAALKSAKDQQVEETAEQQK